MHLKNKKIISKDLRWGGLQHPKHPPKSATVLLGRLYGLSGSSCHLCLEIEIIFGNNPSSSVSTFHSGSSDDKDSGKAGINKMLQRGVVKKRVTQQSQLMMRHKMEQAAKEQEE